MLFGAGARAVTFLEPEPFILLAIQLRNTEFDQFEV